MKNILVIEDDQLVSAAIKRVLTKQNYEVVLAANGFEGVKVLEHETPDLIITDILMPGMDGIQFILKLRNENNSVVPIIAISGGGRESAQGYLESAEVLGADMTLKKPFTDEVLIKEVKLLTERI